MSYVTIWVCVVSVKWSLGLSIGCFFHQVTQRYTYLRQFAPALLQVIELQSDAEAEPSVLKEAALLRELNQAGKRKLPYDAPLGFMPKKVRVLVEKDGVVSKRDWECALLTSIRDEIRIGNVTARSRKRFGRFENFFISNERWAAQRKAFFCLTIVMACLIFWQAREISRVIQECDPQAANIDLSLLEHISPIGWENVILSGEYVLNRNLVRS